VSCPHTLEDRNRDYASEDRDEGNCPICLRAELQRFKDMLEQEYERNKNNVACAEMEVQDIRAERQRLREALGFYANFNNYRDGRPGSPDEATVAEHGFAYWRADRGDKARAALAPSAPADEKKESAT
jgi:hypothetical protein